MIKKLKNPRIKDAKFIIVPTLYEDELLSSWFIRTAYAHHTHPHTFLQLHLGKNCQAISANNFDVSIPDNDLNILEVKSHRNNLKNATLKSHAGYLQENIIDNGQNSLICSLRFCPKCLREKVVYFRKVWKIVFVTMCEKHNCYLKDSCPTCGAEMKISKMYKSEKSFKYCHRCGFDLSKTKIDRVRTEKIFIEHTKSLYQILKNGYVVFDKKPIYSFLFFDAIAQIIKKIIKHKKLKVVQNYSIFKYIDTKKKIMHSPVIHQQLNIKEQFAVFVIVMDLFIDYPNKIKRFILENKISHWRMVKDMSYVSFWYEELVNSISPREVYWSQMITDEEIKNAKNYLISLRIEVNKSSMTRIMGCNFHSSYNNLKI